MHFISNSTYTILVVEAGFELATGRTIFFCTLSAGPICDMLNYALKADQLLYQSTTIARL